MKRKFVLLITIAAVAAGQTASETGPAFGQRIKHNSEDLKQYSYKRRTEITVKGRSRARVELVRYVDGKMHTVPLEAPQHRPEQPHGYGLRGRMMQKRVEKKKEEMKEEVAALTSLLQRYSPGSDSMRSALQKAAISRTASGPDADVKLEARGMVNPNDSFSLVWSVVDSRPAKIEIRTELDNKPVQVGIEYASLPEGPFYAAHTVVSAPKKDLRVSIDTFDYTHSAGAQ